LLMVTIVTNTVLQLKTQVLAVMLTLNVCHTCKVDGLSRQRRSAHLHRFRHICQQYLREMPFV